MKSKNNDLQKPNIDLFYKIPEAKPLLSKYFIDYSRPKVLIKEILIHK